MEESNTSGLPPRNGSSNRNRRSAGCRRIGRTVAAFLAFVLTSSGCSSICPATSLSEWWSNGLKVGPNYCPPSAPLEEKWLDSADRRVRSDPAEDCAWWTVFNDPTLNRLVETAYRQNLDVRAAGMRILDSRAQRNIAIGNLFPQSQTAVGTYVHAQVSKNLALPVPATFNVWADGLNASWELDFWGHYRRSIEAAEADLNASVESYGDTLIMLLSEVATNYVQMRTFEQRLQYARENVAIQRRTLGLAEDRLRSGSGTELDVRQSRSNLSQTESLIPPLVAGHRQASNRLCTLLGATVTDLAGEVGPGPIPGAAADVAVGIPADLLRRRPDVRRAERQIAAQSARIGVAEADWYPRLSINGFVGFVADDFKDLFTSKSYTGLFFPELQWNVLNYGRILNNVKAQHARLEGDVLAYQQAVLNADREVEDALIGFLQAQQQAASLEASERDARRSVELVVLQFQGGVIDFNRVYNTQSALVSIQDQLATTRGNIAINLIQLYKAMGGGWLCFCEGHGMPNLEILKGDSAPSAPVLPKAVLPPAVPPLPAEQRKTEPPRASAPSGEPMPEHP